MRTFAAAALIVGMMPFAAMTQQSTPLYPTDPPHGPWAPWDVGTTQWQLDQMRDEQRARDDMVQQQLLQQDLAIIHQQFYRSPFGRQ